MNYKLFLADFCTVIACSCVFVQKDSYKLILIALAYLFFLSSVDAEKDLVLIYLTF